MPHGTSRNLGSYPRKYLSTHILGSPWNKSLVNWTFAWTLLNYEMLHAYYCDGKIHWHTTIISINLQIKRKNNRRLLKKSVSDILAIIKEPPKTLNFMLYGYATKNSVHQIVYLLNCSVKKPSFTYYNSTTIPPTNYASSTSSTTSTTYEGEPCGTSKGASSSTSPTYKG